MKILVINAGSSSLKYQLIDMDGEQVIAKGLAERIGIEGSLLKHKGINGEKEIQKDMKDHNDAIHMVLDALCDPTYGVVNDLSEISAVGHRVLHGGAKITKSSVVDDEVKQAIKDAFDLGPLHNPANLMGIEACEAAMPNTPNVAVFDTAFHSLMPEKAYLYGLPYEAYTEYKVRRYGFHGTSHRFISKRAAELLGKDPKDVKIITCHLGNGSSVAAVMDGHSVDTSMGLTPLEGLIMGTRSGDLDPAVVKYIMDKTGMSIDEMDVYLNKKSGMLGMSGVSSDFRDVLAAAKEGNQRAAIALEAFSYRVKKYIGAYAAAMGGVDCIVFTAGVGENDAGIRKNVLSGLEWMGVKIDEEINASKRGEFEISTPDSAVKVYVIPTNEELMIARDTLALTK